MRKRFPVFWTFTGKGCACNLSSLFCNEVKNGHIHNGKQRFKCHSCGRQFIERPQKKVIDQAKWELIDRLLLERISLAGIARAVEVSEQWLQTYVKAKYTKVLQSVQEPPKKGEANDSIQCDELWSFVQNKENKQWVWLALDVDTRAIVGLYLERFNNALRQRVSRLVRKTLSFSKSLENYIGAIWYFVHHYNASLLC